MFRRCINVVFVSDLPPVGPASEPITCSKRQSIAPPFGQLASVPAVMKSVFCAHTRLLSKELCQVTSPKRERIWPDFIWIYNWAEEMSDDLHRFAEDVREKSSFRTGVVDGPGDTARGVGQTNISLRADSVA